MGKIDGLQQAAKPARRMAKAAVIAAVLVAVAPPAIADDTAKITAAIAYLTDLDDVAGFRVLSSNTVWISFRPESDSAASPGAVARAAAFKAHKALGRPLALYVTAPETLAQAPNAPMICYVWAMGGAVTRSDCQ